MAFELDMCGARSGVQGLITLLDTALLTFIPFRSLLVYCCLERSNADASITLAHDSSF